MTLEQLEKASKRRIKKYLMTKIRKEGEEAIKWMWATVESAETAGKNELAHKLTCIAMDAVDYFSSRP